jgi:hypothetical protein
MPVKKSGLMIIVFSATIIMSTTSISAPMGTRKAGVAVGESPTVVKRREQGLTIKQEELIKDRHEQQSNTVQGYEKRRNDSMQQNKSQTTRKRPGEVYTEIENGVTVRKRYPMEKNSESTDEATTKLTPQERPVQKEAINYSNLTPWFRAKLEGKSVPNKQPKSQKAPAQTKTGITAEAPKKTPPGKKAPQDSSEDKTKK